MRIAVLDDYQSVAGELADWGSLADAQVDFFHDTLKDADALVARLETYDVLVTTRERTRLPGAVLERLPNLKLIAGSGMRQAHVDMDVAARLGIVVCGTGGSGISTAELAWGLILALTRHIAREDREMRQGRWQTHLGADLSGQTLGVMGMGRLGVPVAKVGVAFGMQVIAWGPTLTPERAAQSGATYVSWDELFSRSDILSIHVPLSDMSRGWITAHELGMMKPTAYLINTSRGPIVQETALLDALREHRIAGAGLDVFDEEPLPTGHLLLSLDNVVLTPHLGYATRQVMTVFMTESVENVAAWIGGEPTRVLNPEVLPGRRP